jgi:hypothetical protein
MHKNDASPFRHLWALLIIFLAAMTPLQAYSQFNIEQTVAIFIQQLQTGSENPNLIGQQLWYVISSQTGNTGIYPPLYQLGPITNITVDQQQQFPQGVLFNVTARHQNGQSNWRIGISSLTNKIEYANFTLGGAPPPPLPPTPPNPNPPSPSPSPTPPPSSACQKYPDLC